MTREQRTTIKYIIIGTALCIAWIGLYWVLHWIFSGGSLE